MKKFLSILMVLALVLSMSVAVFATETENTGSITVTNATVDKTYTLYKIFDASIKLTTDKQGAEAVSYTINPDDNQFFEALFGTDGTTPNSFFTYNANTGSATKAEGVNDSELIDYLTKLVDEGNYTPAVAPVVASDKLVEFKDLPYGYYLITSSLGTTVTISSNTPDVKVIDKNQEPGTGFDKQVQDGKDAEGNPIWADDNTAGIGDKFAYRISFNATNYDGDKKIKYYQIHDQKGDALWAEFDSFKVVVNGKELPRGYYLSQGGINTGNWEFLNKDSDHEDSWKNLPQEQKTRDNAQWYLVHLGYDQFRITIPWLSGHQIKDVTNAEGAVTSYTVNYGENADSIYASPSLVEITYDVVLEANAAIGNTSHGNRFNKANATWTSEHETGSTPPDEVTTYTYGIGLLKDETGTGINLPGAKFRIYRDKECTQPVWVLPTKIAGVYIIDSKDLPIESVTGGGRETTREVYSAYIGDYLTDENGDPMDHNNLLVSQANGKLAVLGLAAGSYFLKEVEAPAGYNALTLPVELKAGEEIRPFYIFADENGNVADLQEEDGTFKENRLDLTHTVVHNSKGVELPSTGGEGTFWMITIGTLLAIGFAVFLITHKKMSIYND